MATADTASYQTETQTRLQTEGGVSGSLPLDRPPKKVHLLMAGLLNIDITPPRCATHIREILCGPEIKGLRDEINSLIFTIKEREKEKTDEEIKRIINEDPKIKDLKNEITDASKTLTRVSSEVPVVMALIMDYMIREILQHAFSLSREQGSKIIEVSHLSGEGVDRLKTYNLFRVLPSFKKNSITQEEKNTEISKTSFKTYIKKAVKRIKNQDEFADSRMQSTVHCQLSDLVIECLAYMIKLTRVVIDEFTGIRTISGKHIKSITQILMLAGGQSLDDVQGFIKEIDSKFVIYQKYQIGTKEKREREKK